MIHLIPYDGIGGVETAARTMTDVSTGDIDFHVETIFPPTASVNRWHAWNPALYVRTIHRLFYQQPNLLIVSLWRAAFVGIVLKLLRPRMRLVLFLHYPHAVHRPDWFLTWLAARLSCEVWADSKVTLSTRLQNVSGVSGRVISFVTSHNQTSTAKPVRPVFVFWGRLHVQKGLQRALRLFARVYQQRTDAQFLVIGPDGGDLARLHGLVAELSLLEPVRFYGGLDFNAIQQVANSASFYLQTSELEGMAMSVVEAMQLGLVPVVTPVGEIAHYARQGENAVVVTDDAATLTDVLALLSDDKRYQTMREQAVATWVQQPLYRDSVLAACRDVLDGPRRIEAT